MYQPERWRNVRNDHGELQDHSRSSTVSTATNRFTSSGWEYDAAGNVTGDAEGKDFVYDAENHQIEVKNEFGATVGEYRYDGEGRRVKKIAGAETTVFVYNASGQLVAEYSTQTAQSPQTSYLTTDHLGSTRLVTDQLGAVKDRKDYSAFGDETITAQRVSGLGYGSAADEVRKGYTGYEKDGESGLEFAQARYYSTTHGRYTSVDPLTASATIRNPQTFNRYTYVLNSPYKFTDPLGLIPVTTGACGQFCRGSGPPVDGSAFRGRDASQDWINGIGTLYQVTRTITFTLPHREYDQQGNVVNEATITVTVSQDQTYRRGVAGMSDTLVSASELRYSSNGVNTGGGHYSQSQLNSMALTAERIVQVGMETNRSFDAIKIMLAKASRKEGVLGIGARRDTVRGNNTDPAMDPMNNPAQLDEGSGFAPRANDWYYNISGAYDQFENVMQRNFPNRPSMWNQSLQNRLRFYNGGGNALRMPVTLTYANQIIATMNSVSIRATTSSRRGLTGLPTY